MAMNRRTYGIGAIAPKPTWMVLPAMNRRFNEKYQSMNFLAEPSFQLFGASLQEPLLLPVREMRLARGQYW